MCNAILTLLYTLQFSHFTINEEETKQD